MKRLTALAALLAAFGLASPTVAQDWGDEDWDYNGVEYDEEYGAEDGWFEDTADYGDDWTDYGDDWEDDTWYGDNDWNEWTEDDYGYYDSDYDYDTNDGWFSDWYGDSDEWF